MEEFPQILAVGTSGGEKRPSSLPKSSGKRSAKRGYPLALKGVVVGQGDTYEEAVADVKSAIGFHVSFRKEVVEY